MSTRHIILLLGMAFLASLGGALAYRLVLLDQIEQSAPVSPGTLVDKGLVGTRRPDYELGSSSGERVSAAEFDGKVVLVNFWATWCAPCRKEMPMLVRLHQAYVAQGFEVVGIAMDEVEQAREFAAGLGIDYPILIGTTDVMSIVREYGNVSGVLPYSVLIDREGIIRWAYLGELKEDEVTREITQLLE